MPQHNIPASVYGYLPYYTPISSFQRARQHVQPRPRFHDDGRHYPHQAPRFQPHVPPYSPSPPPHDSPSSVMAPRFLSPEYSPHCQIMSPIPDDNHRPLRRPVVAGPISDINGLAIIHPPPLPPPPPALSSPPPHPPIHFYSFPLDPRPPRTTPPMAPPLHRPPPPPPPGQHQRMDEPTDPAFSTLRQRSLRRSQRRFNKRVTFEDAENDYELDRHDEREDLILRPHETPPHRHAHIHHTHGVSRACLEHSNCIVTEACVHPCTVPPVDNPDHYNYHYPEHDDDDEAFLDITGHHPAPITPFPRPPFRPDSPPSSSESGSSSSWSSWGGVWGEGRRGRGRGRERERQQQPQQQHRAMDFWCECGVCRVQRRLDGLEMRDTEEEEGDDNGMW